METVYPQCNITIKEALSNYIWAQGNLGQYLFQAKVYRVGSKYGIRNGRISKFAVWLESDKPGPERWVAAYERGWNIRPRKKYRQIVDHVIGLLEAMPPPEDLQENMSFSLD